MSETPGPRRVLGFFPVLRCAFPSLPSPSNRRSEGEIAEATGSVAGVRHVERRVAPDGDPASDEWRRRRPLPTSGA